jgi:outer membrane protein TolC
MSKRLLHTLLAAVALLAIVSPRMPAQDASTARPIENIRARMTNGSLPLTLRGFLELVLLNDTDIRLARLAVPGAVGSVQGALAPFDPYLSAGFNANRQVQPQAVQLGGAPTLSNLLQSSQLQFTQVLGSGQTLQFGFTGARTSTNNAFSLFNPSIATGLQFGVSQSLLRNRGNLQFTGPLQIARIELVATTEMTESQIAGIVASAAQQYWSAVQAREYIAVQQQALDLARKSYDHDEKALQLGALSHLDIYQSQAQVARSEVALTQAQYAYTIQLDVLRQLIGADLDPATRNVPLQLEEDPAVLPPGDGRSVDEAIRLALSRRPDLDALDRRLVADTLQRTVARNGLLPQLDLNGSYGSNGLGGNQVPITTALGTQSAFIPGGFGNALHQMFSFSAPYYGVGLQIGLPFRNSGAQSRLTSALIAQRQDEYEKQRQTQIVVDGVRTAINQREMALAEINSARRERDLAAKNVDAERQKYELGTITAFEELQSQVQLSDAELALVNAYVDYQDAIVAYKQATWQLLDGLGIVVRQPSLRPGYRW